MYLILFQNLTAITLVKDWIVLLKESLFLGGGNKNVAMLSLWFSKFVEKQLYRALSVFCTNIQVTINLYGPHFNSERPFITFSHISLIQCGTFFSSHYASANTSSTAAANTRSISSAGKPPSSSPSSYILYIKKIYCNLLIFVYLP